MGFGCTAPSVARLTPKVKVDMASVAQSALPYRHNSREQRYIPGLSPFLAQSRRSTRRRGQRELALAIVRAAKHGHRDSGVLVKSLHAARIRSEGRSAFRISGRYSSIPSAAISKCIAARRHSIGAACQRSFPPAIRNWHLIGEFFNSLSYQDDGVVPPLPASAEIRHRRKP